MIHYLVSTELPDPCQPCPARPAYRDHDQQSRSELKKKQQKTKQTHQNACFLQISKARKALSCSASILCAGWWEELLGGQTKIIPVLTFKNVLFYRAVGVNKRHLCVSFSRRIYRQYLFGLLHNIHILWTSNIVKGYVQMIGIRLYNVTGTHSGEYKRGKLPGGRRGMLVYYNQYRLKWFIFILHVKKTRVWNEMFSVSVTLLSAFRKSSLCAKFAGSSRPPPSDESIWHKVSPRRDVWNFHMKAQKPHGAAWIFCVYRCSALQHSWLQERLTDREKKRPNSSCCPTRREAFPPDPFHVDSADCSSGSKSAWHRPPRRWHTPKGRTQVRRLHLAPAGGRVSADARGSCARTRVPLRLRARARRLEEQELVGEDEPPPPGWRAVSAAHGRLGKEWTCSPHVESHQRASSPGNKQHFVVFNIQMTNGLTGATWKELNNVFKSLVHGGKNAYFQPLWCV